MMMRTFEQNKRFHLLSTTYRQGKRMHFERYNNRVARGEYVSPAEQRIVDACRAFNLRKDIDNWDLYLDDLLRMIEILWLYGVHSWCADNKWRWFVAGLLQKNELV